MAEGCWEVGLCGEHGKGHPMLWASTESSRTAFPWRLHVDQGVGLVNRERPPGPWETSALDALINPPLRADKPHTSETAFACPAMSAVLKAMRRRPAEVPWAKRSRAFRSSQASHIPGWCPRSHAHAAAQPRSCCPIMLVNILASPTAPCSIAFRALASA